MPEVHGQIFYPGVVAPESIVYCMSHGIGAATAILRCHPQDFAPDPFGDLVITDTVQGEIVLPGCRVNSIKVEQDDKGFFWSVEIQDRRWRWRDLGVLDGCYNQMNPQGKLIPWAIRSPTELATLCLEAMGEANYQINLPPGLAYPGDAVTEAITPQGANPCVNWQGVPPAQALAHLAEQFGCRVVYQWSTDGVYVGPLGEGLPLPFGGVSIARESPVLKAPESPDSVGVYGAPTRYQAGLDLRAVGEDWDRRLRPLDELSYAPLDPVTGKVSWKYCDPHAGVDGFDNVRATDRLTKAQAQQLAANTVYRVYQLSGIDVEGGPIYVPGYGHLKRKEQLVLLPTQVDQIVPEPADKNLVDEDTGEPVNVLFYRGFSQDKPAQCFGAVENEPAHGVTYAGDSLNTPEGSLVLLPFHVDAENFCVHFSSPAVFYNAAGFYEEPILSLQTAVLVRDPDTNALVSFLRVRSIVPEGTTDNPYIRHYPDCQQNVTSEYNVFAELLSWNVVDDDAINRAEYYLDALQAQFTGLDEGLVREYNGIVEIDLDGLTQQITWSVGPDGCSTHVSQNCEHSLWIPPYPARRRAEYLPPVNDVNKENRVDLAAPNAVRWMGVLGANRIVRQ